MILSWDDARPSFFMPGGRAVALRRGAAGPRMLGHRLGATCGEGGRALATQGASSA